MAAIRHFQVLLCLDASVAPLVPARERIQIHFFSLRGIFMWSLEGRERARRPIHAQRVLRFGRFRGAFPGFRRFDWAFFLWFQNTGVRLSSLTALAQSGRSLGASSLISTGAAITGLCAFVAKRSSLGGFVAGGYSRGVRIAGRRVGRGTEGVAKHIVVSCVPLRALAAAKERLPERQKGQGLRKCPGKEFG